VHPWSPPGHRRARLIFEVLYHGVELERFTVEHTAAGLRRLRRLLGRLQRAGVAEVGIERPDGPVVDALLAADLSVLVVPPNQLRNLRGRYGSAGNKDDWFDAFVLADTVRTDGCGCVRWPRTRRRRSRCG